MDRETLRNRFIQTYDPPKDRDPLTVLSEYERFTRYTAQNPGAGSTAVSTALELPRGRVRPWMDGSVPDVVRGVTDAETHGWFSVEGKTHQALTRLVAGIFAGGSITAKHYQPRWSATDGSIIYDSLLELGVGVETIERDSDRSGDELNAKRARTTVGRVLAARGAPVGRKTDIEELPEYLFHDEAARDAFATTYVALRATGMENRRLLRVQEERSDSYLEDLTKLLDGAIEGDVRQNTRAVVITESAIL